MPIGPGRQIVDHVPAQRYRVTVDLGRALAAAGGPLANVVSQAIQEQLTAAGGQRTFTMLTCNALLDVSNPVELKMNGDVVVGATISLNPHKPVASAARTAG